MKRKTRHAESKYPRVIRIESACPGTVSVCPPAARVSAVGGGGERVGAPGLSRGARGVGGVDSMRGVCAAQSVRAARGRPGDSRVLRPPRAQLIIS